MRERKDAKQAFELVVELAKMIDSKPKEESGS